MASSNVKKLGLKEGETIRVSGLARSKAASLLADEALTFKVATSGAASVVLHFVAGLEDLDSVAEELGENADDGRLWVAYPKGASRAHSSEDRGSVLHRDTLQSWLASHGLRVVMLVSLDDTWTAARVKRL